MHRTVAITLALLVLATTACWKKPTLYWTNAGSSAGAEAPTGSVERRMRGDEREVIVDGLRSPRAVAIDTLARKLFYTDPAKRGSDAHAQLTRAELDGTSPSVVYRTNNTFAIEGVAVNPLLGKLYFAQNGLERTDEHENPGEIWVANLAPPFEPKRFVTDDLGDPRDVAVDPLSGRVYWADSELHTISSVDPDGSDRKLLAGPQDGLDAPYGLALDPAARRLYWTDTGARHIARCDLDRCVPEVVVDDLIQPLMLELDISGAHLYWTDMQLGQILRIAIDGKGDAPEVVVSGLERPAGLALFVE